jgi:hypothetical protein
MSTEIEQAAKEYMKGWGGVTNSENSFIEGAKWQAKRSYSYDEVRQIAYNAYCLGQLDEPTENKFNGWIQQIKK